MTERTYRLFFMDRLMTIRSAEAVEASYDAVASALAAGALEEREARAVEVWDGLPRVDLIVSSPPAG